MRDFNEVMNEIAQFITPELYEELQNVIEQESLDNYNSGFDKGQMSNDNYGEGYDVGYQDGLADKD